MLRVALIMPVNKRDYLADTVLDGLEQLEVSYLASNKVPRRDFVKYAREADLIILCWGKTVKRFKFFTQVNTNYQLAEEIGRWDKTVYVDGSEPGGDRRYTSEASIDPSMFTRCQAYFRRERPYPDSVTPLPFGITRDYIKWDEGVKKDIDFFCVFGPGTYAPLRVLCTHAVKDFCEKNSLTGVTERMPKEEFLSTLARSKVGVSVGGGGFDTARFWEILGNNCILMTESIDIFREEERDSELGYKRILQFGNILDFKQKLEAVGRILRSDTYDPNAKDYIAEYKDILSRHSSKARAQRIIDVAGARAIVK